MSTIVMKSIENKDVVLITGAGASHDVYNIFGLGCDLIDQIIERVGSQKELRNFFIKEKNVLPETLNMFRDNLLNYKQQSTFKSIDEFLTEVELFPEYDAVREQYLIIGKASILFHITGWEGHFKNAYKGGKVDIKTTWIGEVIEFIENNKLLDAYKGNAIIKDSLMILTFNYDRLLEYCLLEHFNYDVLIKKWIHNNIIHVYDDLTLNDMLKQDGLEFGHPNDDFETILAYKNKIRTLYERRGFTLNKSIKKSNKHGMISGSSFNSEILQSNGKVKIGCFGFGFDYFNCRNLGILDSTITANIITREKHGIFDKRRETSNRVRTMIKNSNLRYLSCIEFIKYMLNLH